MCPSSGTHWLNDTSTRPGVYESSSCSPGVCMYGCCCYDRLLCGDSLLCIGVTSHVKLLGC